MVKVTKTSGYEFQWGVPYEVVVLEGEVWMDVVNL